MKQFIYALLSVTLMACTTSKSTDKLLTLSFDISQIQHSIPLSTIAKSVKWVELETSDSILVGTVLKVVAKNNQYYVWDENAIYCFSNEGKYLHKLDKKGEGPGYYTQITDFDVDNVGNIWLLASPNRAIYKYSPTGEYLTGISLTGGALKLKLFDDDRMIVYRSNLMDNENKHALLVYDLHTRQVIKRMLPINAAWAQYMFVFTKNHFSNHFTTPDVACNFFQLFNDTIYRLTADDIQPQIVIDKGGKNIPDEFFQHHFENIVDFYEALFKHNYAYGTDFFIENEGGYYYHFLYEHHNHMVYISKTKGVEPIVFSNIMANIQGSEYLVEFDDELIQLFIQANNEVIIPLRPYKIEEYQHKKEASNDRNPILMIVDLQ